VKKVILILAAFSMIFTFGYGTQLYAGEPTIVKPPPGNHFTLNIIAVAKDKNPTMTDSNRHTIFVGLGSKAAQGNVITDIWLQNGYDFKVCDGNGLDAIAYDCSGNTIDQHGRTYGAATFQLPCNTNPDLVYTDGYGCPGGDVQERSYSVWARALGKPGFEASMMTCAYDEAGALYCATDNVLTLSRTKSRPTWTDATSQLTTLVADVDGDGSNETVALFADGFEEFFWQYDNKGLKHAQIRFYPLTR
jgi:hypothetical protein